MRITHNRRLRVRTGRPMRAPGRRVVALAVLATLAVAGVAALPAFAASGSQSVSVSVVTQAVKSITVSPGTNTYTNCVYGTSTATQLGFPDGACKGSSSVTLVNGSAPSNILINGADMIPADSGTHWQLCKGLVGSCSGPPDQFANVLPGPDQYYETVQQGAGYNSGPQGGQMGAFQVLSNTPNCDTVFNSGSCSANSGQGATEFISMTGPQSSSDPSNSFSTSITWIAS